MADQPEDHDDRRELLGTSFGKVAGQYARSRPKYPRDAVAHAIDAEDIVLELGAGTGLLTDTILDLAPQQLLATDISLKMLRELERGHPAVACLAARAEQLPFAENTFTTAIAGQAVHWFKLDLAVPDLQRVLQRGGRLAMIWNRRDLSIDWVREFDRITRAHVVESVGFDIAAEISQSGYFGPFDRFTSGLDHVISLEAARDLVASFSHVSTLEEATRTKTIESALELLKNHAYDKEQVTIPYFTEIFIARSTK